MILTVRNAKATAILALVYELCGGDEVESDLLIEPYLNGREQGFAVESKARFPSHKVAFSEFRNSDSIVLYFGVHADFNMQGNTPSESVYEKKEFLDCLDVVEAAKRVALYLGYHPYNA